jgi:hypothetical protein
MPVSPEIRGVFGHFQNLNLLALLHDLRDGRTARHAWQSGALLCPVAHGLPAGSQVQALSALGQVSGLSKGCHFAARLLGAEPDAVFRFVRSWDEGPSSSGWLVQELEEVWAERLADAQALQVLFEAEPRSPEGGEQGGEHDTLRPCWPLLGDRPAEVGAGECGAAAAGGMAKACPGHANDSFARA